MRAEYECVNATHFVSGPKVTKNKKITWNIIKLRNLMNHNYLFVSGRSIKITVGKEGGA